METILVATILSAPPGPLGIGSGEGRVELAFLALMRKGAPT
jgi:hypothetical protein